VSLQHREHGEVDERAERQRRPQRADRPRARERRELAQILERHARAELRLTPLAVDERDRDLDRPRARAQVREQREQDLEPAGRALERQQVFAPRGEEARGGIRDRSDWPRQGGRDPRRDSPPQRPARSRAAADVTAADRELGPALEQRLDE